MKFLSVILSLACFPAISLAQSDTTTVLDEVVVKGFETRQTVLQTPAAIVKIGTEAIRRHALSDPLPIFNAQAGIRMEERSPGSYRLTLRGSSLRSPYGVRNVKVYWNGIPLSDANGTTYLNLVDFNALGSIEIIKGPAGSIFGAGYGGVVQLNTAPATAGQEVSSGFQAGSFASYAGNAQYRYASEKLNLTAAFSGKASDGYRHHSGLAGYNALLNTSFFLNLRHTLSFSYSGAHTDYQTPGGLTPAQMEADRQASRPGTPVLPSASEQQAGIIQTYHLTGLSHEWRPTPKTTVNSTVFFAVNDLQNPFITSFEQRDEKTGGYRLVGRTSLGNITVYAGSEGIFTNSLFHVTENLSGEKGAFLYHTDLASRQLTHFAQAQLTLPGLIEITGGLSYNTQFYRNETVEAGTPALSVTEKPGLPWSPRLAVIKTLNNKTAFYYTFSNGYSPPTAQEMTANFESAQSIRLLAEKGLSHEIGFKARWTPFFRSDITVYRQTIANALVRHVLDNGNEYFQNTGKILQNGLEMTHRVTLDRPQSYIAHTDLLLSVTLNDFRFGDYVNEGQDLEGKKLPGAPDTGIAFSGKWVQRNGVYISTDVNYLSSMFLNNLNTVSAKGYITSRLRAGWTFALGPSVRMHLHAGADNLLNEKYSLGFDFNAFGNRFYNPAPLRNFHAGAGFTFKFP